MHTILVLVFFLSTFSIITVKHGERTSMAMALPLEVGRTTPKCQNNAGTDNLQKDRLCPSPFFNKTRQTTPPCLSKDGHHPSNCSVSQIVGIRFTNVSSSYNNSTQEKLIGGTCGVFHLILDAVFDKIVSKAEICAPKNSSFVQLFFYAKINDSTCTLNSQEYIYTESQRKCNLEKNVSKFPSCVQQVYNCSQEFQLTKQLKNSGVQILSNTPPPHKKREPLPRAAYSKTGEVKKPAERPEGIRRVKKSMSWSWKDYVLELVIVLIVGAVLLIIWLKICLEERFRQHIHESDDDPLQSRVVRFDFEEKRRKFSHCMANPSNCRGNPLNAKGSGGVRNPSKPILKNRPRPQLSRMLGQNPTLIKSFDSNGSIYYDALEDTTTTSAPGESENASPSQSQSQPLISSQA